jgi:outer membrane protein assembly factor BamB
MNDLDHIAVGSGQWGEIKIYDPRNGDAVFSAANPEHGVSAIAGGNLDGDAGVELVYGAGLTSTGEDLLRIIDSASLQNEYFALDEVGPHSALARGDAAGGHSDQVAYVTRASRSEYAGSNLHVLDAGSGRALRSRDDVMRSWNQAAPFLAIAQLDDDAQGEIVLASAYLYTPAVAVFDGVTLEDEWRRQDFVNESATISSLAMADVNADGVSDVMVALSTGRIHVLDGRNGASIWQSVTIQGDTPPVMSSFSTSSGAVGVLLGRGNGIYVLDTSAGLVTSVKKTSASIAALHSWESGDNCEVGALDVQNVLSVYACADLSYKRQLQMPVETRFFRPFDTQATRFIAAAGHLLYEVRAGRLPALVSGVLGDQAGAGNQGEVIPDADGKSADVVIGSMHMVTRLRVESEDLFADGFE